LAALLSEALEFRSKKWPNRKRRSARKPYSAADVKLLRQHSKAKTPVAQDREANEAQRGFAAAEGANGRNRPRSSTLTDFNLTKQIAGWAICVK